MMLLIGEDFPPDIRVEKEARALLGAGHRVMLVCESRQGRSAREQWQGIDIIRLPPLNIWLRRLNTSLLFTTHRSQLFERAITRLARDEKAEALHVHDLAFVGPGLRVAHRLGLPLVADLHENYPALIDQRAAGG